MHRMPDGSLMEGDVHPSNNNVNRNNNIANNSRNVNIGGDLAPISNGNNNLTGSHGNIVGISSPVGSPLDISISTEPNQMQVNSLITSLAELQSTSNNAVQLAPVNSNNNDMYSLENNLNVNVISNNSDNINSMNAANIAVPTNNNGTFDTGMVDQASPVNRNNNIISNNGKNNGKNNGRNNGRNNGKNNGNNGRNGNNGKKHRVTLVHAEWCGYCKKAKPEWDKLVSENKFNNVELRDITDKDKEELEKYKGKVKGFPTFVVEDISGSEPVYVSQFNAIEKSKMEKEINNATK